MIGTIINLCTFRKPAFARLYAEDVVIEDKAYFLFTWELENAWRLKIPALKFSSFKRCGSAYIAVPDGIEQIELIATTLWRAVHLEFKLKPTAIDKQVDFKPFVKPPELNAGTLYQPQIKPSLKVPVLKRQLKGAHIPEFNPNQP